MSSEDGTGRLRSGKIINLTTISQSPDSQTMAEAYTTESVGESSVTSQMK